MSDSWKNEDEDVECPIPDEFWHIEFSDGTYDRISKEQANEIIRAIQNGNGAGGWLWINVISGSRIFVNTNYIIFLGMNTEEIRRLDRMHTRWLAREMRKDPYL